MLNFLKNLLSARTLSLLILLIIIAAIPLTVFIAQKQQEIRQRAAVTKPPGYYGPCRDLKPSESGTAGDLKDGLYLWRADCKTPPPESPNTCDQDSNCPQNTNQPGYINPAGSAWCFEFRDANSEGVSGNRCLQLRYIGAGVTPTPTAPAPTATPTPTRTTPTIPPPPPTGEYGDNTINIRDYNAFVSCFKLTENKNVEQVPECEAADLNDDGVVDSSDFTLLFENFQTQYGD